MTEHTFDNYFKYLPQPKYKPSYEKRRNMWRCNVPKSITRFQRVPAWFMGMDSLKKLEIKKNWIKKLLKKSEIKEVKPNWFSRFVTFIKMIFKI